MEVQAIQLMNSSLRTLHAFLQCLSLCPAAVLLPAVSLLPQHMLLCIPGEASLSASSASSAVWVRKVVRGC